MLSRITVLILASLTCFAQLAFEVASVKPNHSGRTDSHIDSDKGSLVAVNVPLRRYIAQAYDVREDQIDGPDWIATERFDIRAKAPAKMTGEAEKQMLKTLLADRFGLALHRETRDRRVYALIQAKGGMKIAPVPSDGNTDTHTGHGSLTAQGATMNDLARVLSRQVGGIVVDATGIKGSFNFKLDWDPSSTAPGAASDSPSSAPSLFTALEQQLGLRLEARKMPVEFLVIDHLERVPTEN